MYISEITIEGFKSYAQRVTLSHFDKSFNAITGLNGSGKSNVLDSICFVLGIKNLSQVRASNLQELVYKQGQAGVTKATVSVTWHNNDPETGPAGYEDKEYIHVTRQVVVGGRNKYMINGHAVQENRVQDFFHSVQLNVNNPHFLIMQGRITKVLNMKPPEILSLLEEAAGTRMYEKKKEAALRTLDKKQARLDQIDQVLNGDILPALDILRKACGQYQEWAGLESQRGRLRNLLVAYDYTECNRQAGLALTDVKTLDASLAEVATKRDDLQGRIHGGEGLVRDLEGEKQIQMSGEMRELQTRVDELHMELTKGTTHLKSRQAALKAERAGLTSLQTAAQQLQSQDLAAQLSAAEARAAAATQALQQAQEGVEAAQRGLAGAEAGDGRDHTNRTLKERLADSQREVDAADAEHRASSIKLKLLTEQLASSNKALQACGKEAAKAQTSRAQQQEAIRTCEAKLEALGYDAAHASELEEQAAATQAEVRALRDQVDRLSQDVQGCSFQYTAPPGKAFDASKVRGVLARLVHVGSPGNSLALEVAAGGKLYQVVVDDDVTAKQLLDKGKLTRRVTIIPLNRVQYHELSSSVRAAAERLGGGKAQPALQLVGYPDEVEAAIKYAFGNVLVCQDSGTAKKLAFSREVHCRCVTLEGDDFNPSGLLTGGTRNVSRSVLASLHALAEAEQALAAAQAKLAGVQAEQARMGAKAQEHRKLQRELELARHSLVLLEERLAGTQAAQLAASVEALSEELALVEAAAKGAKARKATMQEQCKALEHEVATFSTGQKARIKAAQEALSAAKAALDKAKGASKAAEVEAVRVRAELDGAASEQEALATRIHEATTSCQALEAEVTELQAQVEVLQGAHQQAEARLAQRKARLKECDADIAGHEKALAKLRRQLQDLEGDARKADNRLATRKAEARRLQEVAAALEKDFPMVLRDKAQFGTGDYDFSKHNMPETKRQYLAVEERCAELKHKVNVKVLDKLQRAEGEYSALMDKRGTVDKDRQRIQEVIEELDNKKRLAMKETWKQVDRDFGTIFSTLLPGTEARLEPPEGQTFEEGLEVRVAFGGVWKASLTELSGGQRSLLALSLILALCKFKPAPLYILDEVDSALDLNHTQNIGRMIREQFPESQFLVVSLKEGMFSNANVIFRTKFVDGISTVTRTTPSAAEAALRGTTTEAPGRAGLGKGATTTQPPRRPLAALNT